MTTKRERRDFVEMSARIGCIFMVKVDDVVNDIEVIVFKKKTSEKNTRRNW